MHIFVIGYAIALFLSLSSSVAALTNAQRLARGLPVLPQPKFGRAQPGYVWTPTAGTSKLVFHLHKLMCWCRRETSGFPGARPAY